MAVATKTVITPDTTIYTLTKDGAGYSLQESILGNQSPAEYAACNSEGDGLNGLCEWLEDMIGPSGGFFLSEKDAQDWMDEEEERGAYTRYEIESFTPRGIHTSILEEAAA